MITKNQREKLYKTFQYTLGLIVFVWVMLVNVSILTRYIFKIAIPWNEELTVLLFNWIIFIGAAMASSSHGHITISILNDSLHGRNKKIIMLLQNLFFMVFVIVVCVQSWKIVFLQARTQQFTAILNIPVYLTTLSLSIGSVIWLAILFLDTVTLLKSETNNDGVRV
jgi:TRAP-type C4-dicarboxylate transport system permease small subunit